MDTGSKSNNLLWGFKLISQVLSERTFNRSDINMIFSSCISISIPANSFISAFFSPVHITEKWSTVIVKEYTSLNTYPSSLQNFNFLVVFHWSWNICYLLLFSLQSFTSAYSRIPILSLKTWFKIRESQTYLNINCLNSSPVFICSHR